MARTREKAKGRKTSGSFLSLPHKLIESNEFNNLKPSTIKLIINLAAQFRGKNNGDLTTAWAVMEKYGWRSKDTLYRAIREAEGTGFILRTRQGGLNKCNLFAITWQSIDECGGKLDVNSTRVASNAWKLNSPVQLSNQPATNIVPMNKSCKNN